MAVEQITKLGGGQASCRNLDQLFQSFKLWKSCMGEASSVFVCSDVDFNKVMKIVIVLVLHATHVFEQLPKDNTTLSQVNHKRQLLDALAIEFDRQTYLSVAKSFNIPDKTAEKQIGRFAKTELINH